MLFAELLEVAVVQVLLVMVSVSEIVVVETLDVLTKEYEEVVSVLIVG